MKELNLGNGLRLTESDDMGIFLHFATKVGHGAGVRLTMREQQEWAKGLLRRLLRKSGRNMGYE